MGEKSILNLLFKKTPLHFARPSSKAKTAADKASLLLQCVLSKQSVGDVWQLKQDSIQILFLARRLSAAISAYCLESEVQYSTFRSACELQQILRAQYDSWFGLISSCYLAFSQDVQYWPRIVSGLTAAWKCRACSIKASEFIRNNIVWFLARSLNHKSRWKMS